MIQFKDANLSEGSTKKPYSKPDFRSYGTLENLTQTVGKSGGTDGGGIASNNKTLA